MRTLLVLLFCLIAIASNAQKRKRRTSFPYTYSIVEEQRNNYVIYETIPVSVTLLENDSVAIHFELPEDEFYLMLSISRNGVHEDRELFEPKDSLKIDRSFLGETFTLEIGCCWEKEFRISADQLNSTFTILLEKRTILNDPDSGGIIINSKYELSNDEIDELVFCYIKELENCYDPKACYITMIL